MIIDIVTSAAADRILTCVLADDHEAVRSATRAQLDRIGWIRVVAEVGDGDAALDAIVAARPDIAVVDVRMPGRTGFEVCGGVVQQQIDTAVVLFTALANEANEVLAQRVGAVQLVSKDNGFTALREALERIRAGR